MAEKKQLNLYQKLLEIQKKIVGLRKDKKGFQYEYVTGNKLLSYLKPLMNEQGLLLKQEILSVIPKRMDYESKGKTKNEVLYLCDFKFTWIDTASGEKDENLFQAAGMNDWEKGMGSAMTYAERYFLLKFFHIATDEDDIDNPERKEHKAASKASSKSNKAVSKETPVMTRDEMLKALKKALNSKDKLAATLKHYGATELEMMTVLEMKDCCEKLKLM